MRSGKSAQSMAPFWARLSGVGSIFESNAVRSSYDKCSNAAGRACSNPYPAQNASRSSRLILWPVCFKAQVANRAPVGNRSCAVDKCRGKFAIALGNVQIADRRVGDRRDGLYFVGEGICITDCFPCRTEMAKRRKAKRNNLLKGADVSGITIILQRLHPTK